MVHGSWFMALDKEVLLHKASLQLFQSFPSCDEILQAPVSVNQFQGRSWRRSSVKHLNFTFIYSNPLQTTSSQGPAHGFAAKIASFVLRAENFRKRGALQHDRPNSTLWSSRSDFTLLAYVHGQYRPAWRNCPAMHGQAAEVIAPDDKMFW